MTFICKNCKKESIKTGTYQKYCQDCKKESVYNIKKRWVERNPELRKEIARNWARKYREEKSEESNKYKRKYYKNNQEKEIKRIKEYHKKYPNKYVARLEARKKIKILKGQLCNDCNINLAKERHHEDYSEPLKVLFLCRKCHGRRHRKY